MLLPVKRITLSGIFVSICIICLYLASILVSGKLSLYALSSFLAAVIIIEINIKYGWIFYFLSSLLSLILIPDKISLIPYLFFFGFYAIIKYYSERISGKIAGYLLKFSFFNLSLLVVYGIYFYILKIEIIAKIPIIAIAFILQFVFFVYDYVFTSLITYYKVKLRKFINGGYHD